MASIRSQILDYVAAKLNGTGKPAGLSVELMRLRNLEEVSLPFNVVRPTGEEVSMDGPWKPLQRGASHRRRGFHGPS